MLLDNSHAALIDGAVCEGHKSAHETAIILVISVRGLTRLRRDYARHSVAASFLTAEELDDVIGGYRRGGFYVQHFPDETAFIQWCLDGRLAALPHPKKLVYTSAVNGTGAGRRCLVPAFCSLEGVPTMNSDAYSCAINRHKFHWGRLLSSFGISVPTSWHYNPRGGWWMGERPLAGSRVIAKATFEGSSIGLSPDGVGEWSTTLETHVTELANDLEQPILVQTFIAGDEMEVPVMEIGDELVPTPTLVVRADGSRLGSDFLSYDQVWQDQYRYSVPADLGPKVIAQAAETALQTVRCLNFRGFSRVDLRVDGAGIPFVIDVSTTPHLTTGSSYAYLFAALGYGYEGLAAAQVGASLRRHRMI